VHLFDGSGRLVRVLFLQSSIIHHQSSMSVVWDGRDDSGAPAAPGMYFVQAGAGDAVQKLVLLR
jgi:flagellar hook assembly protein FlgD